MTDRDSMDELVDQWRTQRPDIDPRIMGTIGRIWRAGQYLDREVKHHHSEHGLESWEFDVLATLRRAGEPYGLSGSALIKATMVTSGAITNRVDRLSTKGLVERLPDPDDRRSVRIQLTKHGKELIDTAVVGHVAGEERLMGPLTAEELTQLDDLLRRLLVSFGDTSLT